MSKPDQQRGDHAPTRYELLVAAQGLEQKLLRVARGFVRCPFIAEDVVQDAYLKLLDRGEADDILSVKAYILRIVRNLAIDRCRRIGFEHKLFEACCDAEPLNGSMSAPDPECSLMAIQDLRDVCREIETTLPQRAAEAFYRHRIEGVAQKEIAETMGVSKSLVCSYICRADAACRRVLKRDPEET